MCLSIHQLMNICVASSLGLLWIKLLGINLCRHVLSFVLREYLVGGISKSWFASPPTVLLTFLYLWQISERINVWRENVYFGPQCWMFQFMIDWPLYQSSLLWRCEWQSKATHLMPGGKERSKWGRTALFPACTWLQWTEDLIQGPTSYRFHCIPIALSWRESLYLVGLWVTFKIPARTQVAHACNPSYSGGRDQFEAS
jgi:hypothetical protein